MKQMSNHPFKKIESFSHRYAKLLLAKWINEDASIIGYSFPVEAMTELPLKLNGQLVAVADIAIYLDGEIERIIEINHKHPVDGLKLLKIYGYQFETRRYFKVYEVNSDTILDLIDRPKYIQFSNVYSDLRTKYAI